MTDTREPGAAPAAADATHNDLADDTGVSRRKWLKMAAAGAVAGIAAPMLLDRGASAAAAGRKKIAIVYFSRTGTTREVAHQIQQRVGGDLIEVRTVHPYPREYRATTEQAKREQEANARPAIVVDGKAIAGYDTIFIGYPNWWGTLPMALFTLLERNRLAGKTLIPFCTHEGSRLGRSVSDLRALCPQATLLEGLALHGGGAGNVQTDSARSDVVDWLRGLGTKATG